jgi:hypothetical protein
MGNQLIVLVEIAIDRIYGYHIEHVQDTDRRLYGTCAWPTTLSSIGRKLLLNMACIVYTLVQTKRELLSDRSRQHSICFRFPMLKMWCSPVPCEPQLGWSCCNWTPTVHTKVPNSYLSPTAYSFIYSYLNFALRII